MDTLGHAIVGAIITYASYSYLGHFWLVFFLASILIDLDHIIIIVREKAYTPRKAINVLVTYGAIWNKQGKKAYRGETFPLHSVEVIGLLLVLSHWYPVLLFVSLGFLLNVVVDIFYDLWMSKPVVRWLCLTYNIILLRKEKKHSKPLKERKTTSSRRT